MKSLIIGVMFLLTSFVTYKLIDGLVITFTANDEVEPPADYYKEVRN